MSGGRTLHITVGAAPDSGFDLTHELRLLKAAMLYADKVKLCSLSSSALMLLLSVKNLNDDDLLGLIKQTAQLTGQNTHDVAAFVEQYRSLLRKSRRTSEELITLQRMKKMVEKQGRDLRDVAMQTVRKAHGEGIIDALNTGLVELQFFDISHEGVVEQYFAAIADSVRSGETYPLLDQMTGNLVDAAIREGKLVPLGTSASRAKQVGLSTDLIARLPLFDGASVDEIIGIRKELDKPLVRFRSAIVSFAREIESTPWQQEFPQEAEQIFLEHVTPSVLEIEEACQSNRFVTKLLRQLAESPLTLPGSSALGLLLSQATALPGMVAQALSLGAGASVVALQAAKEWHDRQREIERNQVYFYYEAGRRLAERSGR